MRYRAKIEWLRLAPSVMWLATGVAHDAKHHGFPWLASVWTALLLLQLAAYLFYSYESTPAALVRRRFGSRTVVPWEDITEVRTTPAYIRIEYGKLGSALNPRGLLFFQPKELDNFLDDLRSHLPESVFTSGILRQNRILDIA